MPDPQRGPAPQRGPVPDTSSVFLPDNPAGAATPTPTMLNGAPAITPTGAPLSNPPVDGDRPPSEFDKVPLPAKVQATLDHPDPNAIPDWVPRNGPETGMYQQWLKIMGRNVSSDPNDPNYESPATAATNDRTASALLSSILRTDKDPDTNAWRQAEAINQKAQASRADVESAQAKADLDARAKDPDNYSPSERTARMAAATAQQQLELTKGLEAIRLKVEQGKLAGDAWKNAVDDLHNQVSEKLQATAMQLTQRGQDVTQRGQNLDYANQSAKTAADVLLGQQPYKMTRTAAENLANMQNWAYGGAKGPMPQMKPETEPAPDLLSQVAKFRDSSMNSALGTAAGVDPNHPALPIAYSALAGISPEAAQKAGMPINTQPGFAAPVASVNMPDVSTLRDPANMQFQPGFNPAQIAAASQAAMAPVSIPGSPAPPQPSTAYSPPPAMMPPPQAPINQ